MCIYSFSYRHFGQPVSVTDEPAHEIFSGIPPVSRRIGDLILEVKDKIAQDARWRPVMGELIKAGAGAAELENQERKDQ